MEPRRVLITGASGHIGTVIRPALREGVEELRLSDLTEPEDLQAPETYVHADLADFDAVQRAVEGVDAVVHLGAVPNEAPFDVIAGPNLHGAFHVFEACRRANVQRIVYASSNHASGMYAVGVPLDGSERAAPGRPLRRVEGLRRGARAACSSTASGCRSSACGSAPSGPRRARSASSPRGSATPTAIRLVQAALTADDVGFAIVYGASANTRRWWPPDDADRVRAAGRRRGLRRRARRARTTRSRAVRTRRFDHGGWAT